MIKKAETGASWTEQDTPCAGYKLATPAQMLLPCHHNHSSNRSTNRNMTESVSQIPNEVREEVKSLVLASFPSYRIRNFITNKHNLPPLMPTVWNTLIRTIKTELGIHDAGQDLKTLIDRLTKERNENGAVFDFAVEGDLTVSTIFEGECSSIRQLACTNPARLSGLVWMELHQAKVRITQHIDREQRMQQQNVVSAAAAVVGGLTSEGFPLSSLLAPVPLTASKPGRPSSKRALAALEGVATKKVNAMLPSHMVTGGGEGGCSGAGKVKRAKTEVSKALHPPPVSIPVSSSAAAADCSAAAAAAAAAAADCSAAASGVSARWTARGRLVVPPVVFE